MHLYFMNPLGTFERMTEPALIPAGSEKPWRLWQTLDYQDVRVYLCV